MTNNAKSQLLIVSGGIASNAAALQAARAEAAKPEPAEPETLTDTPGAVKPDADEIQARAQRLNQVFTALAANFPVVWAEEFSEYAARLDTGKKASETLSGTPEEIARLNHATLAASAVLAAQEGDRNPVEAARSNFLNIAGRAAQTAAWYDGLRAEAVFYHVEPEYVPYVRGNVMTLATARRFYRAHVPPAPARHIVALIYGKTLPEAGEAAPPEPQTIAARKLSRLRPMRPKSKKQTRRK
jgi:hypothetical protein